MKRDDSTEHPPRQAHADDVSEPSEAVVINEVQLLLAEKRTSLAVMRTGIAVFALPLSVLSILVATSKYYDVRDSLLLLLPLLALSLGLVVLGIYLVTRAVLRIHHFDRLVGEKKQQNAEVANLLGD